MNNIHSEPQASVAETLGMAGSGRARRRRWGKVLFVVLALAAAFLYFSRTQGPDLPEYMKEQATRGPLLVTVTATGTLQPTNQVDIGSEISGIIDKVFVDFNQSVNQGDVIAQINTDTLEARAASARASLAAAEGSLAQAQATVVETRAKAERSKKLAERGIQSDQNLETDEAAALRAAAAVKSARAQLTAAAAALRESETALGKAVIRAPISGMIISREVDPGQTVAASFQTPVLFKLAEDLREMRLHLDVDESDIGQVREGQAARFRVDAYPDRRFEATILSVHFNPQTVNNVVTYETILSVDNPDLLLRPGMTATADIVVDEMDDALLVPNRALRFLPPDLIDTRPDAESGPQVWILQGGKPVAVPVRTGLSDGEFTEVTGGDISAGTELIIDVVRTPRQRNGGPFG